MPVVVLVMMMGFSHQKLLLGNSLVVLVMMVSVSVKRLTQHLI